MYFANTIVAQFVEQIKMEVPDSKNLLDNHVAAPETSPFPPTNFETTNAVRQSDLSMVALEQKMMSDIEATRTRLEASVNNQGYSEPRNRGGKVAATNMAEAVNTEVVEVMDTTIIL